MSVNGYPQDHRRPFDLDAATKAAKAEATGEVFEFTFRGESFAVQRLDDWPLQAQAALATGELGTAMRMLLTEPGRWDVLLATRPTLGDLRVLFEAVGEWAGVGGLGNSAAPQQLVSTLT